MSSKTDRIRACFVSCAFFELLVILCFYLIEAYKMYICISIWIHSYLRLSRNIYMFVYKYMYVYTCICIFIHIYVDAHKILGLASTRSVEYLFSSLTIWLYPINPKCSTEKTQSLYIRDKHDHLFPCLIHSKAVKSWVACICSFALTCSSPSPCIHVKPFCCFLDSGVQPFLAALGWVVT